LIDVSPHAQKKKKTYENQDPSETFYDYMIYIDAGFKDKKDDKNKNREKDNDDKKKKNLDDRSDSNPSDMKKAFPTQPKFPSPDMKKENE
jgi:hypothetical protein